jgi:hypothetical protein
MRMVERVRGVLSPAAGAELEVTRIFRATLRPAFGVALMATVLVPAALLQSVSVAAAEPPGASTAAGATTSPRALAAAPSTPMTNPPISATPTLAAIDPARRTRERTYPQVSDHLAALRALPSSAKVAAATDAAKTALVRAQNFDRAGDAARAQLAVLLAAEWLDVAEAALLEFDALDSATKLQLAAEKAEHDADTERTRAEAAIGRQVALRAQVEDAERLRLQNKSKVDEKAAKQGAAKIVARSGRPANRADSAAKGAENP